MYTLKELTRGPDELELDYDIDAGKHVYYGTINTYWMYGVVNMRKIHLDISIPNNKLQTITFKSVSEAKRHIIHRELGIC